MVVPTDQTQGDATTEALPVGHARASPGAGRVVRGTVARSPNGTGVGTQDLTHGVLVLPVSSAPGLMPTWGKEADVRSLEQTDEHHTR